MFEVFSFHTASAPLSCSDGCLVERKKKRIVLIGYSCRKYSEVFLEEMRLYKNELIYKGVMVQFADPNKWTINLYIYIKHHFIKAELTPA